MRPRVKPTLRTWSHALLPDAGNRSDQSLLEGIQPGEKLKVVNTEDGEIERRYGFRAADEPGTHTVEAFGQQVSYTVTAPEDADVNPVKVGDGAWNLPTDLLSVEQLDEKIDKPHQRESIGLPTQTDSGDSSTTSSPDTTGTSRPGFGLLALVVAAIGWIIWRN